MKSFKAGFTPPVGIFLKFVAKIDFIRFVASDSVHFTNNTLNSNKLYLYSANFGKSRSQLGVFPRVNLIKSRIFKSS